MAVSVSVTTDTSSLPVSFRVVLPGCLGGGSGRRNRAVFRRDSVSHRPGSRLSRLAGQWAGRFRAEWFSPTPAMGWTPGSRWPARTELDPPWEGIVSSVREPGEAPLPAQPRGKSGGTEIIAARWISTASGSSTWPLVSLPPTAGRMSRGGKGSIRSYVPALPPVGSVLPIGDYWQGESHPEGVAIDRVARIQEPANYWLATPRTHLAERVGAARQASLDH